MKSSRMEMPPRALNFIFAVVVVVVVGMGNVYLIRAEVDRGSFEGIQRSMINDR